MVRVEIVNHDAQHQLDWLSHALGQDVFTQKQKNRQEALSETPGPEDASLDGTDVSEHASSSRIEIRADPARERRKGVPEVIFAETKTSAQVIAMAHSLLEGTGRAIISRAQPE